MKIFTWLVIRCLLDVQLDLIYCTYNYCYYTVYFLFDIILYIVDVINPDVTVPVGEKLNLRCLQNANVETAWYKDDKALHRSTVKMRVTKQSLKFKYFEMEDAGLYACKLGSDEPVEWRNVTVHVDSLQNDDFRDKSEENSRIMDALKLEEESNDLEMENRSKF